MLLLLFIRVLFLITATAFLLVGLNNTAKTSQDIYVFVAGLVVTIVAIVAARAFARYGLQGCRRQGCLALVHLLPRSRLDSTLMAGQQTRNALLTPLVSSCLAIDARLRVVGLIV